MFLPQKFLLDAIESNDIRKMRHALSNYLTKNPRNDDGEVTDAVNYLEKNVTGNIWEQPDERPLEKDQSKWSEDYLAYLQSDLRRNFSKERFYHFIEVGKVVRRKKSIPAPSYQQKGAAKKGQTKAPDWLLPATVSIGVIAFLIIRKLLK
jgi:hypothetical protein